MEALRYIPKTNSISLEVCEIKKNIIHTTSYISISWVNLYSILFFKVIYNFLVEYRDSKDQK